MLFSVGKGRIMFVGRPIDGKELKLFTQAHVEMLAQDWGRPPISGERRIREWRHLVHVTRRHHHRLHRFPVRAVHS